MVHKVYVTVTAQFDTEGKMKPLSVQWEDGRTFEIDRVLDIHRAASLKAGGTGIRYQCRILGKETYLWFDDSEGKWFVEGKG